MLINRPRRTICKVGSYDIIVASDNQLEDGTKFDNFCQEFKMVLMAVVGAAKKGPQVVPTVAHPEVS